MTDDDQRRVLHMVAEGTISADEGAELLDALRPEAPLGAPALNRHLVQPLPATTQVAGRSLVILITEGGDSKVNVRIPLGLARTAARFIPRQAREYLDEYEIDLKELLADLGNGLPQGPLLEIQDENDVVRIAVE